jgi:L-alanine-DL-glutamate epimerase-like enolase superfamily enzyme
MPRITAIDAWVVDVPLPRVFVGATHPITRAGEVVVRVHTDDGRIGLGFSHGSPLASTAELIVHELAPLIVGHEALDIEHAWQTLFATSLRRRAADLKGAGTSLPKGSGKAQVMAAIGGIDIALWDLAGQVTGQPVWRLLGGMRDRVPAYATGGYYRPDGEQERLAEEFAGYVEQGYRRVKVKTGGRDPLVDAGRVGEVRRAIGPDVLLYVDATRGWTVAEATLAGRAMEEHDVAWFEEPVPWYDDVEGLARVRQEVRIPLCAGESEYTKQGVRDLILRGGIRYLNYDCTKGAGLTDGRKFAAFAEVHDVEFSPHHAAQVHAHLVGGIPNGRDVEMHPDLDRDPLWEGLYATRPAVVDGHVLLDDTPGLGVTLDEGFLARHGQHVTAGPRP